MEWNEKFEEFVEALWEYTNKMNKIALANGDNRRISPDEVEILIDRLKYYLENQEEIKAELQEPSKEYDKLYASASAVKIIKKVGRDNAICYAYSDDSDTLSFGIWDMKLFDKLFTITIAMDTDLQFEDEEELRHLVREVAGALEKW